MGRKKRPIQAAEPVRTIDALVNRAQAPALWLAASVQSWQDDDGDATASGWLDRIGLKIAAIVIRRPRAIA
jgi:hypothetical protein